MLNDNYRKTTKPRNTCAANQVRYIIFDLYLVLKYAATKFVTIKKAITKNQVLVSPEMSSCRKVQIQLVIQA